MRSNMQVATKIFVASWVTFFTLARVKGQDCRKENINYEHVLKSDLHERYATGVTLRLKCTTGYVGLLKLECQNGTWNKSGRDCKKRACGHPGDTPNGQFSLKSESEFLFGATVEYTCNTGYIMASRINYRNCRSQGWDNAVPVCEVVKCPPISNLGDVIATGNTEEASYGDVIHFECPFNKMINGSEDIHCKDNGQWSDVIPTCKEIKCLPPKIPHGFTSPDKVYNNNNILQYSCSEGYKTRLAISKCTRDGWTIEPACEEITCEYPYGEHLLNSQFDNSEVYKFKQRIQYHCEENYQSSTEYTTCTVKGWDPKPLCIEITCKKPEIAHGKVMARSKSAYKPGQPLVFQCDHGYESQRYTVTCKQNGEWDKLPDCKKKEFCAETSVHNGFTHEVSKGFYYSCDSGYKAFDEQWWGVVICNKDQWSYAPLCISKAQCGQIPIVHAKHNQEKKGYNNEETVELECDSEPCCFKCISGKWEKQYCEGTCGTPPPVENAVITFHTHQKVKYDCRKNYEMKGNSSISCNEPQWYKPPTCELNKELCAETSVHNGFTHQVSKGFFYSCDSGYKAFDEQWWGVVICNKGQWSYAPLCISKAQCGQIPKVHAKHNQEKKGYNNEETVELECDSEPCCFKCISGKWEEQHCEETCGTPPSVENAVITSHTRQQVKYECRENYEMKGNSLISCNEPQWDKPPTCESLLLNTDQDVKNESRLKNLFGQKCHSWTNATKDN